MRFRNATRLLTDNFSNVYKLLLFRLVTAILFCSLAFVIINRGLHVIFESPEAQNIAALIREFFQAIATGRPEFEALADYRDNIISAIGEFFVMVGTNVGSIVGAFIGVCVIYLFARILNGTATFAVGGILNDKMEAYSRPTFASSYFRYLGKSMLYHLIYVPCSFLYDVVCLGACWFFFFYTPSLLPSWGLLTVMLGLALSVTAFVLLLGLKLTFISAWIPAIVADGKTVREGGSLSFKALKGFGGRYSSFVVAIYLILAVNVMFGLCTFGASLLLTIPTSYFLILCLQFVYYYEDNGKKYFLSFRKISGADGLPESMGD